MALKRYAHDLLHEPGIAYGFYTRQGGVSTGLYESLNTGLGSEDNPDHVTENRARVADDLGTSSEKLLSLWQHHSRDVLTLTDPFDLANRPKADGMVTDRPGLALSAMAADCGPVLFLDPERRIIGACHAGWRGALSGITDATIDAMEALGSHRMNIHAVLGPCISQQAYEVGPEFRDIFAAEDEVFDRFFVLGPEKESGERRPHFDLKRFILMKLQRAGLIHIDALPHCTYLQPEEFYSYRYNTHHGKSDYGRNISAIMLKE